jgi:hypothetical protein
MGYESNGWCGVYGKNPQVRPPSPILCDPILTTFLRVQLSSEGPRPHPAEKERLVQMHISFISKQLDMLVCEEVLKGIFAVYGHVADVAIKKHTTLTKQRRQTGYGFVYFLDPHCAYHAVNALKGNTVRGITLDCSISHRSEVAQGRGYGQGMQGVRYGYAQAHHGGQGRQVYRDVPYPMATPQHPLHPIHPQVVDHRPVGYPAPRHLDESTTVPRFHEPYRHGYGEYAIKQQPMSRASPPTYPMPHLSSRALGALEESQPFPCVPSVPSVPSMPGLWSDIQANPEDDRMLSVLEGWNKLTVSDTRSESSTTTEASGTPATSMFSRAALSVDNERTSSPFTQPAHWF